MLADVFNYSAKVSQVEFNSFQLGRKIEEGDKAESELHYSLHVELVEELHREMKSHSSTQTRQLKRHYWVAGMKYVLSIFSSYSLFHLIRIEWLDVVKNVEYCINVDKPGIESNS